ncbi:hypothetical protein CY0110_16922 [Crocosphaera chwakensis CCY0110]|uniref:Uncharacterized protein n=1 Tax=Crocosphaera chwakensis CCY0110 TaxID=391612 RepID=A3II66_9CHRO|nr:hypothetical protein CY0110_16922 [Crocosphaera chwakensis CCY0110]
MLLNKIKIEAMMNVFLLKFPSRIVN